MRDLRHKWAWLCVFVAGCAFDASGEASTAGTGDSTGAATSMGPSASSAENSNASATDAGATVRPNEGPRLEFEQGALFDFGSVNFVGSVEQELAVSNVGGESATAIGFALPAPEFTIAANACPPALAPGETCVLRVRLTPSGLGEVAGTLTVDYASPAARVELGLAGRGSGETENLLVNGDGEVEGAPPPGWTEVDDGDWRSDDTHMIPAHSGTHHIWAGYPSGLGEFELQQEVVLASHVARGSTSEIKLNFDGWAQSWPDDIDRYRIVVEFGTTVADGWDSDWQSEKIWTRYVASIGVPTDASTAVVRLRCEFSEGEACTAHFDDLVLTLTHGR